MSGEGVVLDADLAALVPEGATLRPTDRDWGRYSFERPPHKGDLLVAIGGHPISELVSYADALEVGAAGHRADGRTSEAEFFDELRRWLVHPAIVAAWHTQHDSKENPDG